MRVDHSRTSSAEVVRQPPGLPVRLTWLLALLATLALETAIDEGDRSPLALLTLVAGELSLTWVVSRHAWRLEKLVASRPLGILLLASVPFVVEMLVRAACRAGLPLELMLLSWFRNGTLAMTALSRHAEVQRVSCAFSMFLVIFASSVSGHPWLHGLVILFAVAGIWWLLGSYWETLGGRLAATSARELPRRWWLTLPLVCLALLAVVPATQLKSMGLEGFVPSSGGSRWYDESARSGVGDGDALVAGTKDVRSFAPIENAPFLNSHEPTLYDLVDDRYDEPVKPGTPDRAIALPPQLATAEPERPRAESRLAGREFSTVRKTGRKKSPSVADRDSPALFYVKGRVPLHLKLDVFDRYDGYDWFPQALDGPFPRLTLETINQRPWLRAFGHADLDLYGLPEVHNLKFVRFDTNRIPSPVRFLRLHLDQLDRADLFGWSPSGVLRMERDRIPPLTVMHVQSSVIDERKFSSNLQHLGTGPDGSRQFSEDPDSLRIRALAEEWTADLPRGWPQVAAIVSRLREACELDDDARPSEESRHTIADFLFRSRRGPDYQFAGAAVWMLRSLGYGARLVNGFYVDPDRYEARSRHTPVMKDNMHFWAEVHAGLDHWLPIEPTPGYELLKPDLTMSDKIKEGLLALAALIRRNVLFLTVASGLSLAVFLRRERLTDALVTLVWRISPTKADRAFVRRTQALLDSRLRRAGMPRPPGTPLSRWLLTIARRVDSEACRALAPFAPAADWAAYAPPFEPAPEGALERLCRQAERACSWRRIRQCAAHQSGATNGTHRLSPARWTTTNSVVAVRSATRNSVEQPADAAPTRRTTQST